MLALLRYPSRTSKTGFQKNKLNNGKTESLQKCVRKPFKAKGLSNLSYSLGNEGKDDPLLIDYC